MKCVLLSRGVLETQPPYMFSWVFPPFFNPRALRILPNWLIAFAAGSRRIRFCTSELVTSREHFFDTCSMQYAAPLPYQFAAWLALADKSEPGPQAQKSPSFRASPTPRLPAAQRRSTDPAVHAGPDCRAHRFAYWFSAHHATDRCRSYG